MRVILEKQRKGRRNITVVPGRGVPLAPVKLRGLTKTDISGLLPKALGRVRMERLPGLGGPAE